MTLRLQEITSRVDGEVHIHPTDLTLEKGTMNVLLGPTRAGKTSLMRLMAGLDTPDAGRIYWNGEDVTGARVQDRNIAMVYQQFVNYPSMSVYENIASPLRLQRHAASEIDARVRETADLLRLGDLLDRKPDQLSGGQQQRCAIARALVKDVGLVLMDEPLANLDYKLREELRLEIPRLFAATGAIFVYATTEPEEALLLGGNTACLWEGRVTQFGPAMKVYRDPIDEISARIYSDPPLNCLPVRRHGGAWHFASGQGAPSGLPFDRTAEDELRACFRAHQLYIGAPRTGHLGFEAQVLVTEITGSETFLHLRAAGKRWVALVPGVHDFAPGAAITLGLDPADLLYFTADGERICASASEVA